MPGTHDCRHDIDEASKHSRRCKDLINSKGVNLVYYAMRKGDAEVLVWPRSSGWCADYGPQVG